MSSGSRWSGGKGGLGCTQILLNPLPQEDFDKHSLRSAGFQFALYGEPEDFLMTRSGDGVACVLITEPEQVTQMLLHHLRLTAVEEELSRISFIAVPALRC